MQATRATRAHRAAPHRASAMPPRRRAPPPPRASAAPYVAPSKAGGATALDMIRRHSEVVPDTVLLGNRGASSDAPTAATVSAAVLAGLVANPGAGLREYQTAIERAHVYAKCTALTGDARAACVFDKALVNVGALFAAKVSGRVSTEVDARCAHDADAMVARGTGIMDEYKAMGVPADRVLLRLPATWDGIEAARRLEAAGVRTHVVLVGSFVQAAAAAQAGAAVVQPSAGQLADWFRAHPNAIRDPRGPREDSGYASAANPGIDLAKRIWAYCRTRHPGTRVMVSGVRSRDDALALAGVDFIVAGPKVLDALAATPTRSGYNDGLVGAVTDSVDAEDGGLDPLTDAVAAEYEFDAADDAPVTRQLFEEGLGATGRDVLAAGVARLAGDVDRVLPLIMGIVSDNA